MLNDKLDLVRQVVIEIVHLWKVFVVVFISGAVCIHHFDLFAGVGLVREPHDQIRVEVRRVDVRCIYVQFPSSHRHVCVYRAIVAIGHVDIHQIIIVVVVIIVIVVIVIVYVVHYAHDPVDDGEGKGHEGEGGHGGRRPLAAVLITVLGGRLGEEDDWGIVGVRLPLYRPTPEIKLYNQLNCFNGT
jgi:hypothetical protein